MKVGVIRGLLVAAALASGQATAPASAPTSAEVRGKRVVNDAVKALGGEKFLQMEDRIESGRAYSFYRERLSGLSIAKIYTTYITVASGHTADDLGQRERQAFGKNEDSYVLFREDGAWDVTFRGARELEPDRIQRYHDATLRNIFYLLRQRLEEPGLIIESRGVDVVDNQPVEIVEITDAQDRVIKVFFHQSLKLPVREEWSWRDPKTRERNDEMERFARYREVKGGIQWPHEITRERNGEKTYQIFSDAVSFNQNLTDNIFSLPAGQPKFGPAKKK
ncbi:MAG TPA: hypothetical protein VN841_06535 [Bryobacteraceae bacterium]|nr:hypothetical protein [Bryobacteraceae bacterium]